MAATNLSAIDTRNPILRTRTFGSSNYQVGIIGLRDLGLGLGFRAVILGEAKVKPKKFRYCHNCLGPHCFKKHSEGA